MPPSLRDAPPVPGCVPEGGTDEPDDDFTDTNCDGIDGDAATAVFAAPNGDDGAEGTRSTPVKSLNVAIGLATQRGQRAVYACVGEYPENVEVTSGVSIYGGYDCTQRWKRIIDIAVINPKDGVPLTIRDVDVPVVIDRVAVRAADATRAGGSSIAARVSNAADVSFTRSELRAGNGRRGDGAPAAIWSGLPEVVVAASGDSFDGPANCTAYANCDGPRPGDDLDCTLWISGGGRGPARMCPNGDTTRGGFGGIGGNCASHAYAGPGLDGLPPSRRNDGVGSAGRSGGAGKAGGPFGSVVNGVYVASNSGSDGEPGATGTAGRGGDGNQGDRSNGDFIMAFEIGGGGGQGGYPGCGGPAGKGGQGGGASIALLIAKSHVLVRLSNIATGSGGDGGPGSLGLGGERGQPGGRGGHGAGITEGMAGRAGGDGGDGGAGGPGGGGPSIGVLYVGATPTIEDSEYTLGDPGKGPVGALKASDGLRAEIYSVKEQPTYGHK